MQPAGNSPETSKYAFWGKMSANRFDKRFKLWTIFSLTRKVIKKVFQ